MDFMVLCQEVKFIEIKLPVERLKEKVIGRAESLNIIITVDFGTSIVTGLLSCN